MLQIESCTRSRCLIDIQARTSGLVLALHMCHCQSSHQKPCYEHYALIAYITTSTAAAIATAAAVLAIHTVVY